MTNHVHLILDPGENEENLAKLMKRVAAIPEGEWDLIRSATQRGQLTGGSKFYDLVADRLGQRVEARKPGRPRGTIK